MSALLRQNGMSCEIRKTSDVFLHFRDDFCDVLIRERFAYRHACKHGFLLSSFELLTTDVVRRYENRVLPSRDLNPMSTVNLNLDADVVRLLGELQQPVDKAATEL